MSDDEDEFAAYDLSEFTSQDFAQIDAGLARPAVDITVEQDSPFHKFLSWKNHLAVTDITGPLWCETQYEYSLYGRRNKPLHLRPSSFTSKKGKQIRVQPQIAQANDRTLKRGKSVHKALEVELRPDKIVVHAVTNEERFGLRILQLIDGFNQLVSTGVTRELPVFTITHGQVVLGIIDEVLLTRTRVNSSPPCSPPRKRLRMESATSMDNEAKAADPPTSPYIPEQQYELRILDYKTRRSQNVPLDQDSLSPRIQLMMYHRMLSAILEPETFDFDLLWSRLNVDPMKPFSDKFVKDVAWEPRQADSTDRSLYLNRLVSEWKYTMQRQPDRLVGVSRQLQIVYRRSAFAGKQRNKGKHRATETVNVDDPLEALVLQEELDIARAVEASLSGIPHQEANQVARQVAHHAKQAGPSSIDCTSAVWKNLISPLDSGQSDPSLAWAIQQSLLDCADKTRVHVTTEVDTDHGGDLCLETWKSTLMYQYKLDDPRSDETKQDMSAPEDEVQGKSIVEMSPIIGTKEFEMNDEELDAQLADVLQWWFGMRPARGVDVSQTNRCFTCEYRDSCEWREQKAKEAAARGKAVSYDVI